MRFKFVMESLLDSVGSLSFNWFKNLMASFLVFAIGVAVLFISSSMILAVAVYGLLMINLYKYVMETVMGNAQLENLFKKSNFTLTQILLGVILTGLYVAGLYVYVVPAFALFLFYGMAIPVFVEKETTFFDTISQSVQLSKRNFVTMLIYALTLAVVVAVIYFLMVFVSWIVSLIVTIPFTIWYLALVLTVCAVCIFLVPVILLSSKYVYNEFLKQEDSSNSKQKQAQIEQTEESKEQSEQNEQKEQKEQNEQVREEDIEIS